MSRDKKSIETQVQEQMPEFAAEVASLSVEELEARLSQTAKDRDATEQARDDDEQLEQAQASARELGAPYRDALKAIKLRSKYIIQTLKERGK